MTLEEAKQFFRKDRKVKGKLLKESGFTLEDLYNTVYSTTTPLCYCGKKIYK